VGPYATPQTTSGFVSATILAERAVMSIMVGPLMRMASMSRTLPAVVVSCPQAAKASSSGRWQQPL